MTPERSDPDLPCPCCGFVVFSGTYGSYVLCPVCEWEDDGMQLANPTSSGGANRDALVDAQRKALAATPLGFAHPTFKRRANWRPLNDSETSAFRALQAREHWHSPAVLYEREAYWARAGA